MVDCDPKTAKEVVEIVVSRPSTTQKFGMMIGVDPTACGGHALTTIRDGGVLDQWNTDHTDIAICIGDVIVSVNGKDTFDAMMNELKQSLECTLKLRRESKTTCAKEELREDTSEAAKEKAQWDSRRARVTAALIPGLKKIIESEFGTGASERIGRVEKMYQLVGRGEVHEEELETGKRFAPGYVEGLSPVQPFHSTQDYPWCAELSNQWKSILKELQSCQDNLWRAGAYEKANSAYGPDWKILPVLTEDRWQNEDKFKATIAAIKQLQGITPSEAFFARMPGKSKISSHSDNLNYILTSHLALDLEEGSCFITVGNEERAWEEGKMLVFDTSFMHSTRNESDRARYILVLRFWHPGLTEEERRAIHLSHTILASAGVSKK